MKTSCLYFMKGRKTHIYYKRRQAMELVHLMIKSFKSHIENLRLVDNANLLIKTNRLESLASKEIDSKRDTSRNLT